MSTEQAKKAAQVVADQRYLDLHTHISKPEAVRRLTEAIDTATGLPELIAENKQLRMVRSIADDLLIFYNRFSALDDNEIWAGLDVRFEALSTALKGAADSALSESKEVKK